MRKDWVPRHSAAVVALLVALGGLQGAGAEGVACGEGLEVHFRLPADAEATAAAQGRVVLVEVRGERLQELQAAWVGQQLHFWPAGASTPLYRALIGVDLEQKTGEFPLTLNAGLAGGRRVACSALLRVAEGQFRLEKLTVAPGFVELSARDRERADRETKRLLEIFAGVTPERFWKGPFRAPLGEAQGSGNFGARRILNDEPRSPHGGEDFSALKGTPVLAPAGGRVALADNLFFSGNTVVLDHGLGLYTFYGHLDTLAVEEGETVEAGEKLGTVGATGRVTGPHLHWAARLNRARVNPLELVGLATD